MGTSAFDPVVLADVRSVRHTIDVAGLTGDVLAVGDVVRYDPSADQYILAKANNEANSRFIGVVESISSTKIDLVYSGEISLPNSLFGGETASQVFYLSATNAGKLTATAPSSPGSVIKPVILVSGTLEGAAGDVDGIVVNTTGQTITGDSSVDLSEVQPVGTISAFAGNTSDIPAGWDICDGGYLDISTYSDLYSSVNQGKIYGFTQTIVSTRSSGTIQTAASLIGTTFSYIPSVGSSIECTILSATVDASGNITTAEVFVNPLYASGSSAGTYHNTEISATASTAIINGTIHSITGSTKQKFKKPDLRARFLVGSSKGITGLEPTTFQSYTIGMFGGEEEHALSIGEMPIHNHEHGLTASVSVSGLTASHSLTTQSAGSHVHNNVATKNTTLTDGGSDVAYVQGTWTDGSISAAGNHDHVVSGSINVSASGFNPVITGNISNRGSGVPHNNLPPYMAVYWIIKTRKDSVAKLFKLGPSGGGAIIAKNTAKRWARMATPGAGCTVDISYGAWGVSRLGTGDYRFTHDMTAELGTGADQTKYIVEATVVGSGSSQMLLANPYSLEGTTLGVRIWDVRGATFSDTFQYLCLTVYGGGTAL